MTRTVGIDIDQTLNNLNKKWFNAYNLKYNDNLKMEDVTRWGITEFVKPECGNDIFNILSIPGFFRDLEVQPNAQEVMKWLCAKFEVYIVSSARYDVCNDKGLWLKELFPFIPYNNVIFCHNKSLIHLDYLLDDGIHNLETFTGIGLLFDAHHNQNEDRFPRLKGWLEVKDYFEKELLF